MKLMKLQTQIHVGFVLFISIKVTYLISVHIYIYIYILEPLIKYKLKFSISSFPSFRTKHQEVD